MVLIKWWLAIILVIVPIETSQGGLILEEDLAHVGNFGELLVDMIVPQHTTMGLQNFPEDQQELTNQTVMVLSEPGHKRLCELMSQNRFPEISDWLGEIDVIIYLHESTCASTETPIGAWSERGYFSKWCRVSPIVISMYRDYFPGIFANWKSSAQDELNDWIEDGHPCYVLGGKLNTVLSNFANDRSADDQVVFKGTIVIDKSLVDSIFRSWPVQAWFRIVMPLLFTFSFMLAVHFFIVRVRFQKLTWAYGIILVLNGLQSLTFAVLNGLGTHFLSSTLSSTIQLMTITNTFGLSVATDAIFAALLSEILRSYSSGRPVETDKRKVIALATFIAFVDLFSLALFGILQTEAVYKLVSTAIPGFGAVIGLCVNIYLLFQLRAIAKLLLKIIPDDARTSPVMTALKSLAETFYFWSKITVVSFLLTYLAMTLLALKLWTRNPINYVLTMGLLDLGKVLNMISQTKCCAIPEKWAQHKSSSKPYQQQQTVGTGESSRSTSNF